MIHTSTFTFLVVLVIFLCYKKAFYIGKNNVHFLFFHHCNITLGFSGTEDLADKDFVGSEAD